MGISEKKIGRLRALLSRWGGVHIRKYAWRYQEDPYAVLVAEFMLHRTQKDQVQRVYSKFMKAYPTLNTYQAADREEVRNLLLPLGLNWRIEGMLAVLDSLWEQFREVPADKERLIRERSVGQYIAGATATFARNSPHALVDTNTVRVVGRVFGLNLVGEARRRKEVIEAVEAACDPENPREFYYAMIDLAHELCRPRDPACHKCPLLEVPCSYGKEVELLAGAGA
ncbi:MAG: hypothetical protein ACC700_16445 [Anaerolineales bacterium]